jgi:hypothetical protein
MNLTIVALLAAVLALAQVPAIVLLLLGARKMARLELRGLAIAAAVVAMLPCHPGFIVGLPVGLWALLVLLRPEVAAAFRAQASGRRARPADAGRGSLSSAQPAVTSSSHSATASEEGASVELAPEPPRPRWRRMLEWAGVAAIVAAVVAFAIYKYVAPQVQSLVPQPVGFELVYDLAPTLPAPESIGMWGLYERAQARIDARLTADRLPLGEISVAAVGGSGSWSSSEGQIVGMDPASRQITVSVYGDDPVQANRVERLLAAEGRLQLRVLADRVLDQLLVEQALALPPQPTESDPNVEVPASGEFTSNMGLRDYWIAIRRSLEDELVGQERLVTRDDGRGGRQALVLLFDDFALGNEHVVDATYSAGVAPGNQDRIFLDFDSEGADRLARLTRMHLPDEPRGRPPRRLGFIVDGTLWAAVEIRQEISDRAMLIGDFEQAEAEDLAAILRSGPLHAKLTRVSRRKVE